jgi:hypothetical protein
VLHVLATCGDDLGGAMRMRSAISACSVPLIGLAGANDPFATGALPGNAGRGRQMMPGV